MSNLFHTTSGKYLISYADIKAVDQTLVPDSPESVFNLFGVVFVLPARDIPVAGAYQGVRLTPMPELVDGVYYNVYEVYDLFTAPVDEIDEFGNPVTLSVQQQKDRYDLQRLDQQKMMLGINVTSAYNEVISMGSEYTFPDMSVGRIPLTDAQVLKRFVSGSSSAPNKVLELVDGSTKTLSAADFTAANQSASDSRSSLDDTAALRKEAVAQLMSLTDAAMFEPKEGFPSHIPPKTITLLVDVDGMDFDFANNPDSEANMFVGLRPNGTGKGFVNLSNVMFLQGAKRVKSVGGVVVPLEGLEVDVMSGQTLAAKVRFTYNSPEITAKAFANATPLNIPNIVVGF